MLKRRLIAQHNLANAANIPSTTLTTSLVDVPLPVKATEISVEKDDSKPLTLLPLRHERTPVHVHPQVYIKDMEERMGQLEEERKTKLRSTQSCWREAIRKLPKRRTQKPRTAAPFDNSDAMSNTTVANLDQKNWTDLPPSLGWKNRLEELVEGDGFGKLALASGDSASSPADGAHGVGRADPKTALLIDFDGC